MEKGRAPRDTPIATSAALSPSRPARAPVAATVLPVADAGDARHADLAHALPWGVIVHTGWVVAFVNRAAAELLGAADPSDVLGRPVCEIMTLLPSHLEGQPSGSPALFAPTTLTRLDGAPVPVNVAAIACRYHGREGAQLIVRPTTATPQADAREQALRRRDLLTELPNRLEFRERLLAAIGRARRSVTTVGVLILDLADFARLNAERGHAVGDGVLQGVAGRLLAQKRQGDTLARIGGDAFGVILEGVDSPESFASIAQRFADSLTSPFTVGDATVAVRARVGVADFPRGGNAVDTLLTHAEVALAAAKQERSAPVRLFSPELESAAREEHLRRHALAARFASLTLRERQVVEGLVAGRSNKAIAKWLGCSPRTVEAHRARIMEKMESTSLPDLVRLYLDVGLPQ